MALTRSLVADIRGQIAVVGFWENGTKQDELRKGVKRNLDDSNLFAYDDLDELAVDLVALAKANQRAAAMSAGIHTLDVADGRRPRLHDRPADRPHDAGDHRRPRRLARPAGADRARRANESNGSSSRSAAGCTASSPRRTRFVGPPVVKQFVDGEGFAYLGRNYRLKIDDAVDGVRLDRGRFLMSPATAADGDAAMRRWYVRTGQAWLQRRVEPWARRMGAGGVGVAVRDLGYRWGSTRGETHINIHWATLQLAPSLIDYVIVHELAHLKELNHTDRYWAEVARAMPDYERRRDDLTTAGVKIWTCRG